MDTQKYQALLQAIEAGSFSAAAAELGYTPSGISHMVEAVENQLGLTLLRRSHAGVTLTENGQRLLPALRELLHAEALLLQEAEELRGLSCGRVSIGSYSSIAAHWLPRVLCAFQEDFTGVSIQLMEGVQQELDSWMEQRLGDFCLYSNPPVPHCEWIPLRKDPMLAVLPPEHPLAREKAIRLEQCQGQPFIMPSRGEDYDVVNLLRECGVQPQIRFSTIENYAAMSLVEYGLGISIMNELITKGRVNRVVMLPFDPPRHIVLGVAIPSQAYASPAARKMIEYIRRMLAVST